MPNVDVTKCARDKGKSEFGCLLWTFPYHFTSEAIPGIMGREDPPLFREQSAGQSPRQSSRRAKIIITEFSS